MTTINYAEPALYRANPPRHRANWSDPTTADATTTAQPTIIIVDDDPGIREALEGLLRSVGLQVKALGSVPGFVKEGRPEGPACLVLDVRLPGRSGLDFSARAGSGKHSRSDHLHHRIRRHPNVRPGDKRRGDRV